MELSPSQLKSAEAGYHTRVKAQKAYYQRNAEVLKEKRRARYAAQKKAKKDMIDEIDCEIEKVYTYVVELTISWECGCPIEIQHESKVQYTIKTYEQKTHSDVKEMALKIWLDGWNNPELVTIVNVVEQVREVL